MNAPPATAVMTVLGPVAPGQLGFTLPHEHIFLHHSVPHVILDDLDTAVDEVAHFRAAGGGAIVEMTNQGLRRNPVGLR
jgi:phosphotriesterase-related protein